VIFSLLARFQARITTGNALFFVCLFVATAHHSASTAVGTRLRDE